MSSFSVSGSNNGQIVGKDAYYSDKANKNDAVNEIMKSQGGGKKFGFDSGLMVKLSVQQIMGGTVPELKQSITNANVRIGALTSLSSSMNTFLLKTVDMLSDASFLSGFDVGVGNTAAASAKVNENANITKATQYSLDVKQIATTQTIATNEYSPNTKLGEGELEFSLGSYEKDGSFKDNRSGNGGIIKIESGDTLGVVADKINDANMGITANLVTDPNGNERLAIYSNKTGADSAINIKASPTSGVINNKLSDLGYNGKNTATYTEKVAAQNAKFSVNGIDYETTSNEVPNIMGLDLKLTGATSTPTTISVSQDTKVLVGNVQFFVDNFNSIMDVTSFLDNPTPGEKFQGALHDSKVIKDLKEKLSDMDNELAKTGSSLEQIGIKTGEDGFLSFDRNKLEATLKVNPKIVNDVFLNKNKSSTRSIEVTEIGNTKTGGYYTKNGKYDVVIQEKAEPAKLAGGAINYPINISPSNSTIKMSVNGIKMDIKLQEGKQYTANQLSLEVSNQINRNPKLKANADSVTVTTNTDGSLNFASNKTGTKYSFAITEDNKALGLVKTAKVTGKDVMGKINGITAIGEGDTLSSMIDKDSKGIVLTIDKNVQINKVETITIQRGYLNSLKNSMGNMINNDHGTIKSAIKDFEKSLDKNSLDSLVSKLDAAEDKSDKLTKQYWGKYSNVESALSKSSSVQDMLNAYYFNDDKDK